MILDQVILADLRHQWQSVMQLTHNSTRVYQSLEAGIMQEPPPSFFNLPLVLAYAVLDQVLSELVEQRTIPRPAKRQLGARMTVSLSVLAWLDYALVDKGREARNALAHEAVLLSKPDCIRYVDAIGAELDGWGML
jgi:hypothetical protein